MTGRCDNCGTNHVTLIRVRFVQGVGIVWAYCSPCYEAGLVSRTIVPVIL